MTLPPDKPACITLKTNSNAANISFLSEALHALCLYASGSVACALDMQRAAVEALNNVVEHAYDNQPGYDMSVCWYLESRQLRIEIIDSGLSMAFLPEPVLPDFDAEGGRGWWIINACVDEYFYTVIESDERQHLLRPGDRNENISSASIKPHSNILTLIKQF